MAGSVRGPVGKRDEERVRRNKREPNEQVDDALFADLPFEVDTIAEPPPVNPEWHEIAKMQYEHLLRDPARIWMSSADWALSYLMCESISREMKPQAIGVVDGGYDPETGENVAGHVARELVPMKGQTITAVLKWYSAIGVTEGARMALKKELTLNRKPKADTGAEGRVVKARPEAWFSRSDEDTA